MPEAETVEAVKEEEQPAGNDTAAVTAEATTKKESETENKTEEKKLNEADTLKAVAERLAFFFSDANIRQDTFIRKQLLPETDNDNFAKKEEENDNAKDEKAAVVAGTVAIEGLLRFNTIKQYTTDPQVVAKAAQTLSDTLTVSEDGKAIGRVKPFTTAMMDDNIPTTLMLFNIPVNKEDPSRPKYAVTADDIKALFSQYGEIALVKLRFGFMEDGKNRRKHEKQQRGPIGSALVEFETKEALELAAAETIATTTTTVKEEDGEQTTTTTEHKRKLELGGQEVNVIRLKDYIDNKNNKRKAKDEESGNNGEIKGEEDDFTIDWKPGCVIKMQGLSDKCSREDIMESIGKGLGKSVEEVKKQAVYIDYSRGQTEGAIRFADPSPEVAELLQKLSSGDLEVVGAKVSEAKILDGEEEKKYWDDFVEFKKTQRKNFKPNRNNYRNNNRNNNRKGGYHNKRQRRN